MPKISELPSAQPLSGSNTIVVVQGGTTVRSAVSSISTYLVGTTLSAYATTASLSAYLRIPTLLSASSNLSGNELLSISQGGNSVRTSLSSLNSYLSSTFTPIPSSIAPSTSYTLPLPSNGTFLGEKKEYFIRPSTSVDLNLNVSIKRPSDSGLTFPKTLTANELYIVVLRWNGSAWMLVSLVGGYA